MATAETIKITYSPVVLCNTEGMSEQEWLGWRRNGIGGSDAGTVFGVNPYRTKRDLYFDKIGVEPVEPKDDFPVLPLRWGHALEPVIADEFAHTTGLKVRVDKNMYQHPLYPFMVADVDRLIDLPDGTTGILEIKTANPAASYKWADGGIPYSYELQVRHYMAVMNIDVAYICCAFENNSQTMVIRRLDRDLDFEEQIIESEREFWEENVLKQIPPVLTGEAPELAMETLRKFYAAKPNITPVSLDGFKNELEKIEKLRDAKSRLEKEVKSLDEQIKVLQIPILDHLGENTGGAAVIGNKSYELTYKAQSRTGVSKDDLEKMAYSDPDAYKKYVKETATRVARFSVKAVTPKK